MATELDSGPPASARPTGTVTFLFSDIEGSTVRWERNRDAMALALARHDTLMRTVLEARGAYVFKTVGDAFCAAFTRPSDALAASFEAQHALAGEDFSAVDGLRVRMALHTGNAFERDGDYFGPTVNRVARLLSVGHGGQVLISGACTELIGSALPPACGLRDLGDHRLKDLAQPERIHQLLAPQLIADFPLVRSLEHLSNNLPAQVSSFIGRETEIADVTAMIGRHRMMTLVGSGGVGKTRLSLQVAADRIDVFHDGVWFVELAPLTQGDYISTTVASALSIRLSSEGELVANLASALKGKELLLVFDNCEHLVEPAAHVISTILRAAPKVKVLASSRQALGIAGEATYHVPTLDISTATTLFVERARAANATFSLTGETAPIVGEICRRLDGIALAIELAAARVKVLSISSLAQRLNERFRVLTGGGRDALPRQQTLRAMIDWSHDLLDERERTLFRRVGIFVSGFALEGALAVGSDDETLGELEVFDVLASLIDKSLVLAEPHGDALRYRVLESTRAYAVEKLDAANEHDRIAGRHLLYLRDHFAERWERRERTARSAELVTALQTEIEDVRSALDSALRSQPVEGAELFVVTPRWETIGLKAEAKTRCEALLEVLPAGQSRLRALLLHVLSTSLGDSGHKTRGFEVAAQAVEHARASNDASCLARALLRYSTAAVHLRRIDEAERALAQAEAMQEASATFRITLLESRASFSQFCGDLEAAARALGRLRMEHRSLGDAFWEQNAVANLAEVEHERGRTHEAVAIVREALPAAQSGSDKGQFALLLQNLAGYLVSLDDLSGAATAARQSIGIHAAREPDHNYVAIGIEHLALAVALRGDLALAATLEGYADTAFERHGFPREFNELTTHARLTALLRESLAPDERKHLAAEGAALTPEAAIALALARGDFEEAMPSA
jgi:predicted ATPase/class 3 adenylate cyclase